MPIKLAEQVFLCSDGITGINSRSKEFALALRAACHCGDFALVSQDGEATLCHGEVSLAQVQALRHSK